MRFNARVSSLSGSPNNLLVAYQKPREMLVLVSEEGPKISSFVYSSTLSRSPLKHESPVDYGMSVMNISSTYSDPAGLIIWVTMSFDFCFIWNTGFV